MTKRLKPFGNESINAVILKIAKLLLFIWFGSIISCAFGARLLKNDTLKRLYQNAWNVYNLLLYAFDASKSAVPITITKWQACTTRHGGMPKARPGPIIISRLGARIFFGRKVGKIKLYLIFGGYFRRYLSWNPVDLVPKDCISGKI